MIRVAALASVAILLVYSMARAEEVRIRSGEHEDFTRLVLEFASRQAWQFGRVDGGFELRTDESDIIYDMTRIYDLIPRTRIGMVEDRGDGRLFLSVTCACHGDAFDLRGTQVVLDIKDGTPLSASVPFNQSLPDLIAADTPSVPKPADKENDGSVLGLTSTAQDTPSPIQAHTVDPQTARLGLPLFLPIQGAPHGAMATETAPPDQVGALPRSDNPVAVPGGRVAQTEAELLEQIGRAAVQGLIEADLSDYETRVDHATNPLDHDDAEMQARQAPSMPDPPPTGPEAHVRVQTVIDRDNRLRPAVRSITDDGKACPDDALFDVGAWGGGVGERVEIGTHRKRLLGEFDQPDPAAIEALVRYYIYLTFGAEAAALTATYQDVLERPDIYFTLAGIVDGTLADGGRLMAPYLQCGGKVALWSALAQADLNPGQVVNTAAVLVTFSDLPVHLRRHLGPPLASKFIASGDETTAVALRNAIARAPGPHGAALDVLNAEVAVQLDDTSTAITALEQVIDTGDAMSPEAVIDLIDLKRRADAQITPREMEIAASLAFERRGTEMGTRLIAAEIEALLHMQRFNDAVARYEYYAHRGEIATEVAKSLRSDLLKTITAQADDVTFLRHAVAATPADLPSSEARLALATRLLNLGFAHEARAMIAGGAQIPNRDERMLFARIAMAERKFDVALGYLAGLDSKQAKQLAAKALASKQDHIGAARAYVALDDPAAQSREAWRGGDWTQVADVDDGILGRAGALMLPPAPEPTNDLNAALPVLETDRALLDQSRATRTVLTDLLDALAVR